VDSQGGVETSIYDNDNRLQTREFAGISTTAERIDLTYKDNGWLDTEKRYSDVSGTTKVGATTMLYDAVGRVTGINHYNGTGTALLSYVYNWDSASRLTSEVDNGTPLTFTYDNANQETADGLHTYTYDSTGNRNNGSWTVGTGNQLTNDGTWAYSYDNEGNLTKKTKGASAETWTYGYDNKNELVWAEDRATDGGTLLSRVDYKYDPCCNRLQKAVDSNGDGVVDTTQRFALDGWNPAKAGSTGTAGWDVWADLDGNSSLTTRYLRGDVVDQLFARVASDGTAAWLLTDHLGSVVGVTNGSGVLKDQLAYDGWGGITSESDSTWGGRYKWTGREYDTETQLQYNRARYYDSKTGKWISQDPLGFDAGDSNLYRYVTSALTTTTDPSGLQFGSGGNGPTLGGNQPSPLAEKIAALAAEIGRSVATYIKSAPKVMPQEDYYDRAAKSQIVVASKATLLLVYTDELFYGLGRAAIANKDDPDQRQSAVAMQKMLNLLAFDKVQSALGVHLLNLNIYYVTGTDRDGPLSKTDLIFAANGKNVSPGSYNLYLGHGTGNNNRVDKGNVAEINARLERVAKNSTPGQEPLFAFGCCYGGTLNEAVPKAMRIPDHMKSADYCFELLMFQENAPVMARICDEVARKLAKGESVEVNLYFGALKARVGDASFWYGEGERRIGNWLSLPPTGKKGN
jgi:RHS repeat-associated protein